MKYKTDPAAGHKNRAEYARLFGVRGEKLIEQLGRGHHRSSHNHAGNKQNNQMTIVKSPVTMNSIFLSKPPARLTFQNRIRPNQQSSTDSSISDGFNLFRILNKYLPFLASLSEFFNVI